MKPIKTLGLRTTIYKVNNIEHAKIWYAQAFAVEPYFDQPYYVGFDIGGYELGLQPEEISNHKSDGVVAYWGVENVEQMYNQFIELGATENEKPENVGEDIIVATVKDPWQNIIGLIYNPHFKVKS